MHSIADSPTIPRNELRCPISGATEKLWGCPLIPYEAVNDEEEVRACKQATRRMLSLILRLSVWNGFLDYHAEVCGTI